MKERETELTRNSYETPALHVYEVMIKHPIAGSDDPSGNIGGVSGGDDPDNN